MTNHPETPDAAYRGLMPLLAACSALGPISTLLLIPALPAIRDEFGAPTAAVQAVISVFLLTFAIGIPLAGPLSDRYGRRPLVLGGLGLFIAGSALAAVAPTLKWLVVGRVIQGVGCAANATVARAILGDLYQDWRLARALAQLTLVMMIGTSVSPYLGGLITETSGWHAPFLWLLAFALVCTAAAWRALPETRIAHAGTRSLADVGRASLDVLRSRVFLSCAIDAGVIYGLYLGLSLIHI